MVSLCPTRCCVSHAWRRRTHVIREGRPNPRPDGKQPHRYQRSGKGITKSPRRLRLGKNKGAHLTARQI